VQRLAAISIAPKLSKREKKRWGGKEWGRGKRKSKENKRKIKGK
jgi:hypothetical protein